MSPVAPEARQDVLDIVRRAREAAGAATARYRAAVVSARAAGSSAREIAAAAGVSRQAVYALLEHAPAPGHAAGSDGSSDTAAPAQTTPPRVATRGNAHRPRRAA